MIGHEARTITVLRGSPGGEDELGDPIDGDTTEHEIEGCMIAPTRSEESSELGRAGLIIGWTVYAPPGADVRHTDRVRIGDDVLEVEGEVGRWDGAHGGTVIYLRRARG